MKKAFLIDEFHKIQENSGKNFISFEEAKALSKRFGIPLSEIFGTGTFYSMLSFYPRGKHIIRVCGSLSCHLAGNDKIIKKLKEVLGIDFGQTTKDGEFTLEESSCLGLCSVSPAIMIDETPYGRLTPEDIPGILKKVREGDPHEGK